MSGSKVAKMIASAGGLGLLPLAPGTWGALGGVCLQVLCILLLPQKWEWTGMLCFFLLVLILGMLLGSWAEKHFQRKDPPQFVLDEVAGYLFVVLLFSSSTLWRTVVYAFVTARFFDIVKPPPIRRLEKLPAGLGIMADDLLASCYAVVTCYAIDWLLPKLLNLFGSGH